MFGTLSVLANVTLASPNRAGEHPLLVLLQRSHAMRLEREHRRAASRRLESLGLRSKQAASCDKLSLGQMKRVAIARAVQTGARILMLDEPLAGLDGDGQRDVLRYLREIANAGNHAVVVVEHLFNLPKVLELATHVWTLRDGVVEVETPQSVREEVDSRDLGVAATLERLRSPAKPRDGGRLEARGLVVRRGLRRILDGYDFCASKGAVVPIAHPNGWGKTTLFDALSGLLPVEGGEVMLDGRDITTMAPSTRVHLGLSYLRATGNVFPGLTIDEHFALGKGALTIGRRFADWRAKLPLGNTRAALLSGGERQRLALACLPISSVMLLDEPFLNLDAASIREICAILSELDCTRAIAFPTPDVV